MGVPWKPEKGIGTLGTGVIVYCELPTWVLGFKCKSSNRAAKGLDHRYQLHLHCIYLYDLQYWFSSGWMSCPLFILSSSFSLLVTFERIQFILNCVCIWVCVGESVHEYRCLWGPEASDSSRAKNKGSYDQPPWVLEIKLRFSARPADTLLNCWDTSPAL